MLSAGLPVVVTWRPAQTVLLSVQGMDVAAIAKEERIAHLYAIADREFGPLNLQLRPGWQRAPVSGKTKKPRRHDAIPGRDKHRGGVSIGLIRAFRTP